MTPEASPPEEVGARFLAAWSAGGEPPDVVHFLNATPSLTSPQQLDVLLIDQHERWERGVEWLVEDYLRSFPSIAGDETLRMRLVVGEFLCRKQRGQVPDIEAFVQRFSDLPSQSLSKMLQETGLPGGDSTVTQARATSDTADPFATVDHAETEVEQDESLPASIGRYAIQRVLGTGAFGTVYQGQDTELQRSVAIKVPRAASSSKANELFLAEARHLASLDHPNIVPVYDLGIERQSCFVVSKYIAGIDASRWVEQQRPTMGQIASRIADVADALHHAHTRGLFHRDVKPANILLDEEQHAYLADFGIALKDEDLGQGPGFTGTPAYMSPEQARGDGHLIDGRSDIFSLGIVLYELLTGTRPFRGNSSREIIDRIESLSVRPPRQIRDTIPLELERICLKCLEKEVSKRYATAADLAKELRRWQQPKDGSRRGKGALLAVAAAVLLLIAVALGAFWRPGSSTEPGASAEELAALRQMLEQRELDQQLGPRVDPTRTEPAVVLREGIPELPTSLADLEAQLRAARAIGDEERESNLLLKATNETIELGRYRIAESLSNRMVEIAGNDPSRRPFAYGQLGLAQLRLGKAEQAITSYQEANRVYKTIYKQLSSLPDNPQTRSGLSHIARLVGLTEMRIGNANSYLQRYQAAQLAYQEAETLFTKHQRDSERVTLLLNYGSLESKRGNYDEAMHLLQKGRQLAGKLKEPNAEAEMLINLGNTQSRSGDNRSALQSYQEASELVDEQASYQLRVALLCNWILTLLETDQTPAARQRAAELKELARDNDEDARRVLAIVPAVDS